ncbi:MAG: hypothetical protein ICV64_00505 [Thermoleophilia bacterium]|nr:hypothetical protein [Thermoleophilia bacterium]
MPRHIPNFWVTTKIDGYSSVLTGGPQHIEGGFELTVQQRDDDGLVPAVRVVGRASPEGEISLEVYDGVGRLIARNVTRRWRPVDEDHRQSISPVR